MSPNVLRLVEGESVDKKKALDAALGQIERAFGKGSIMRLGEDRVVETEVVPTGSLGLDIALGIGVLVRRYARAACLGMIAVTFGYLALGTWLTPGLWLDPLGAFVKTVPAMMLAAVAAAILEDR